MLACYDTRNYWGSVATAYLPCVSVQTLADKSLSCCRVSCNDLCLVISQDHYLWCSPSQPLMQPFTTSMRKHISLCMVACSHAITVVSNEVVQGTTLVYNIAKPEQYIDEACVDNDVYAKHAHEHTPGPVCLALYACFTVSCVCYVFLYWKQWNHTYIMLTLLVNSQPMQPSNGQLMTSRL